MKFKQALLFMFIGAIGALAIPYAAAQITAPTAVTFLNEEIRPWCEKVRALNVEGDAIAVKWFAGMNSTISNTSDVIEDGREGQGVSRVTGADVNSVMNAVLAIQTALASYDTIISKPTVRPLEAN